MIYLGKYRKLSVIAVSVLILTWLSAMAVFWNTLLKTEVKNEGWFIIFMFLAFLSGIALFYFAFTSADSVKREKELNDAYESGKMEILQEQEQKKQAENRQQVKEDDIRLKADAILSGIQATRSASGLCNKLLSNLARELGFVQGVMYTRTGDSVFTPAGEYALTDRKPEAFKNGETIASQAVLEKSITVIHDIPENYFSISSGLGSAAPSCLLLAPMIFNNDVIAVLELATFSKPDASAVKLMEVVLAEAGIKLNKFIADKS
jgi:uncharacterized membrane protein